MSKRRVQVQICEKFCRSSICNCGSRGSIALRFDEKKRETSREEKKKDILWSIEAFFPLKEKANSARSATQSTSVNFFFIFEGKSNEKVKNRTNRLIETNLFVSLYYHVHPCNCPSVSVVEVNFNRKVCLFWAILITK